jgi:hypothetical protein
LQAHAGPLGELPLREDAAAETTRRAVALSAAAPQ